MEVINKLKSLLLVALLAPAIAFAQGGPVVVNGDHVNLSAPDSASGTVSLVAPNASGFVDVYTGGTRRVAVTGAGLWSLLTGTTVTYAPYTVTAVSTPVAGTNKIDGIISVFPTAAANTGAFLPTPAAAGVVRMVINSGPNAVRVVAPAGGTVNGATYVALATFQQALCLAQSTTAWNCALLTVPTPA